MHANSAMIDVNASLDDSTHIFRARTISISSSKKKLHAIKKKGLLIRSFFVFFFFFFCKIVFVCNVPVDIYLVMSGRSHRFLCVNLHSRWFVCLL